MIRAAGAVVWRKDPQGHFEIALVHRPRYDDWSLPKGKAKKKEPTYGAVVREIAEEINCDITLDCSLGETRYLVDGEKKKVHYWCARVVDVSTAYVRMRPKHYRSDYAYV
ncbi:MAG: NUDIX domain-containing protein, partial [Actinomycetaceae bacterium]|nr:NUDIX domain-containing protein [Actinomycetaceae bacterium]